MSGNWRDWPRAEKERLLQRVRTQLDEQRGDAGGQPLSGHELPWREWLKQHFPRVCTHPFAPRHVRLWDWFEALTPGLRPRPRVEVWPRGGAKSTTTELGCVRACVKLSRRYVLYVSETQDQADKHVQSIGTLLEGIGAQRALNVYGTSKGWKRQELRTANGFNVSAYGLDTAARGVKLDQYRPDLIIFDDIDSQDDSARTVEKKVGAITTAIIPAGSSDAAFLFLQNLIHEEGVFAQLVDGRADFLHNREPAYVEPAVHGLQVETAAQPDGTKRYRIASGTASWAGQSLAICEAQINEWGLRAFQREAQHEVRGADGIFFDVSQLRYLDAAGVPPGLRKCRAWDLAATEGGGDHTAGVLIGVRGQYPDVAVYILDVQRGQWGSNNVRKEIAAAAEMDGSPAVLLRIPQDPGQAGVDQADQFKVTFRRFKPRLEPITGDKATRATGLSEAVNKGNVFLVRAAWNPDFREELRKFREDLTHAADDQVDAASDAFNELVDRRQQKPGWRGKSGGYV